jgi:nucleotide-binding universal stress UspA family protein
MEVTLFLHPTDGSPQAAEVLDVAIDLAAQKRSRLVILHVQPVHGGDRSEVPSGAGPANAEQGKIASAAMGREAREIVGYADQVSADMILIGSSGRGSVDALFLGSVAQKVVADAPCTCVVVK